MERKKIRILVIDDHPFFLEGLKLGLESVDLPDQEAFALDTVTSPSEALKKLVHTTNYDLILCDLHLPCLSGIEFIERLFKQDIWIPVAIISASENVSDIEKALEAGAAGFINKTLSKQELTQAIAQILTGKTYLPPNYARFRGEGIRAAEITGSNAQKLGITKKQFQVLTYMSQGLSNKEISEKMAISVSTVKTHSKALFQTFNVKNRTACILSASKLQILPEPHLSIEGMAG